MIDIKLLQDSTCHECFTSGQFIVPASGSVKKMYVLVSGAVGVYDAGGTRESTIVPGHLFGDRSFFGGKHKHNYRAEEDAVAFAVTEDSFEKIVQSNPALMFAMMREAYVACGVVEDVPAPAADPAPKETAEETVVSPAQRMQKVLLEKAAAAKAAAAQVAESAPEKPPVLVATTGGYAALLPKEYQGYPDVRKPEYKQFLFDKDYKCPYCGKSFSAYKIFVSKLMPTAPARYDFRKTLKDFQMEWYSILVCPECYFSMLIEYFTEPISLVKQKIEKELQDLRGQETFDFTVDRDLDFVFASHYLALRCSAAMPSKQTQVDFRLWSELSWLYEDVGDREMEVFAANKAAEMGEAMYMSGTLNPVQEQTICLQTAGMLYRTGERENMARWLFKAKTSKMGKRIYVNMAEDLWDLVKEEKK